MRVHQFYSGLPVKQNVPIQFGLLKTAESVTSGHPDKVADQISDAILDKVLSETPDPKNARVAVETLVKGDDTLPGKEGKLIVVAGEIRSPKTLSNEEIRALSEKTIRNIGYTPATGFSPPYRIISLISQQSSNIANGVDNASESRSQASMAPQLGAGDQGIMVGYATNETQEMMPLPIIAAHRLTNKLEEVRRNGTLPYLRPDGKSQVTIDYDDATGQPVTVKKIVISTQHAPEIEGVPKKNTEIQEKIKQDLINKVIRPVFSNELKFPIDDDTEILINPSGEFVIGGPVADAGLTGRKVVVDAYGPDMPVGGGAFSGKDPTKVDRSAAYAARYVAKNLVASGLADKCKVTIAYAIGKAEPLAVTVDTFGTHKPGWSDRQLENLVNTTFDLTPNGIIQKFDLQNLPKKHHGKFYEDLAAHGHFGNPQLPWEKVNQEESEKLRNATPTNKKPLVLLA